jgi:hypothetical protein
MSSSAAPCATGCAESAISSGSSRGWGARVAGPRDLAHLAVALRRVDGLKGRLAHGRADLLAAAALDPLAAVAEEIGATLVDALPPHARIPGFIRPGRDAEIDGLREAARDAKGWLARF